MLFVTRFPSETTEDTLREKFKDFGELVRCQRVKNYAFISYKDIKSAESAKLAMSGNSCFETPLVVEIEAIQEIEAIHIITDILDEEVGVQLGVSLGVEVDHSTEEDMNILDMSMNMRELREEGQIKAKVEAKAEAKAEVTNQIQNQSTIKAEVEAGVLLK
ncbi:MAG: hypothetical protein EZS28_008492 [Streblomastix strix]|uniref:RRM domain-containing protein n=1 Tax=Streblomastix strix TaxID=222440 RepID=A0A5J4WLM9_9EUKA|nr:MAG: hypothetical protein EZS28_008492 [Streblomastix strix]